MFVEDSLLVRVEENWNETEVVDNEWNGAGPGVVCVGIRRFVF